MCRSVSSVSVSWPGGLDQENKALVCGPDGRRFVSKLGLVGRRQQRVVGLADREKQGPEADLVGDLFVGGLVVKRVVALIRYAAAGGAAVRRV
jgi:hypothetical protein